jgi:arginine/ornithine N-succinyltransferase beta subunit
VLHLVAEHSGPSEVCSLFLKPDYRKDNNGRLLSLSRFLFMSAHLAAFEPIVLAEIRGVIDDRGRSDFWDALGKHFFDIDFPKADYLSLINKRFIADLMPKHPIYTPLLSEAAQKVIGQPHEQSRPALKLLEAEGFRFSGMVDIFEAGPTITCPLMEIRAVRESKAAVVAEIGEVSGEEVLIGNTSANFRCCKGALRESGEQENSGTGDGGREEGETGRQREGETRRQGDRETGDASGSNVEAGATARSLPLAASQTKDASVSNLPVRISVECARALRVARGDQIRYVAIRPAPREVH